MPLLPPPLPPSAGRFSMVATTWLGCGGWCGGGGGCGGEGWRWWRWRSGESIAAGLRLSGERGASRREGGGRCCRRRWLPRLPGSARPSPAPPSLGCHAARGGMLPPPPASAAHGRRSGSSLATLLLLLPHPPRPAGASPRRSRRRCAASIPFVPARRRPALPWRTAAAAARCRALPEPLPGAPRSPRSPACRRRSPARRGAAGRARPEPPGGARGAGSAPAPRGAPAPGPRDSAAGSAPRGSRCPESSAAVRLRPPNLAPLNAHRFSLGCLVVFWGGFFGGLLGCILGLGMLIAGRQGTSSSAAWCYVNTRELLYTCLLKRGTADVVFSQVRKVQREKSPLNNALALTLPEAHKGLREAWQSL